MSGIGETPTGTTPPEDTPTAGGWPQQDFGAEPPWDVKTYGNRRRATTAEQAVPWLIGLVLALAGMLLVLLALIFSSNDGLLPAYGSPTPEPTLAMTPAPEPSRTPESSPGPTVSLEPAPTPAPGPAFAPLEITFMQRTSASGPVHLFSHDFAGETAPDALLRDDRGVDHYAWSPDGAWGVALVEGDLLVVTPGQEIRDYGDEIDAVAIAPDGITVFALRVTLAGSNDRAELMWIDVTTGATQAIQTWFYPHPITYQESAVKEAQFADDGGFDRLYLLDDGQLVVWILGAPTTWLVDPATAAESAIDHLPTLFSPNGQQRVEVAESGGNSQLTVRGAANEVRGSISVVGLVSHLRWSSLDNQVVFTITQSSGGAVVQDLHLWDLTSASPAVRLTQDSGSMGGGFRGVEERWRL